MDKDVGGAVGPADRYASGEGRGGVGLTAVIWVRRYGVVPEPHSRSAGM